MPTSVIYVSSIVENKNPHHLADGAYYLVYMSDGDMMVPALFTQHQVSEAMHRAIKNPEDAPKLKASWLQRLAAKFKWICQ